MRFALLAPAARAALVLALALSLAGCASDHGPRRGGRGGPPPKPVIPLAGDVLLLQGQLRAEVSFGPMRFRKEDTAEGRGGPAGTGLHGNMNVSGHNGNVNGGGGLSYDMGGANVGVGVGGGGMGGGASFGGGRGGGGRGGRGGPPDGERGERRGEGGGRFLPAFGPLAEIHLRFTNTSPQKLSFRVDDFSSPLGNFVVQPAVFTLEPGQSAEAEQMSTQLGGDITGVDITVAVRTLQGGDKQILTLRPVKQDDAPPAPPPAPPAK